MSMSDNPSTRADYRNGARTKSSDEIEREVEDTRYRVRETLDELRERMSPGQMVDQLMDYAKSSGGGDFGRNLGRSVRDNPLPVMLIGAGIAWLMMGNGRPSGSRSGFMGMGSSSGGSYSPSEHERWATPGPRVAEEHGMAGSMGAGMHSAMSGARSGLSAVADTVGSVASGVASAASGVASAASSAYDSVTGAAAGMRDAAYDVASGIGDRASRYADTAGHYAGRAGDYVGQARGMAGSLGDGASHAMASGRRRMHDLRDQAGHMGSSIQRVAEEQPLILGAVGLAVGAALGAAFPSTRTENRLFGDTADRLKDEAYDLAAEQAERAHRMAREAASVVGERIGEVSSDLGAQLADIGSEVRDTVVGGPGSAGSNTSSGSRSGPGASGSVGSGSSGSSLTGRDSDPTGSAGGRTNLGPSSSPGPSSGALATGAGGSTTPYGSSTGSGTSTGASSGRTPLSEQEKTWAGVQSGSGQVEADDERSDPKKDLPRQTL